MVHLEEGVIGSVLFYVFAEVLKLGRGCKQEFFLSMYLFLC